MGGDFHPLDKMSLGGTKLSWGGIFWRCLWIQRVPPPSVITLYMAPYTPLVLTRGITSPLFFGSRSTTSMQHLPRQLGSHDSLTNVTAWLPTATCSVFTNHVVMTNYFAAIPHNYVTARLPVHHPIFFLWQTISQLSHMLHVTPYGPPAAILVIVRRTSLSTLYVVVM